MDMNKVLAHYNITEDIRFMEAFLKECYCHPYNLVEYLEDWYKAKNEFLFKLFGDKVTIDCGEICFDKTYYDIERDMLNDNDLCNDRIRLTTLVRELAVATLALPATEEAWWTRYPDVHNELFVDTLYECTSFYGLFHNGETLTEKKKAKFVTGDGRNEYVYIHKHQKIAKVLNNFYRTIEKVFPKQHTEKIAEARHLTSKVLAQVAMYAGRAKTTGRLHLSIHPFDYITMSQNACGWSSCMVLCDEYEEVGDYCAGTVAMMNSKNTIVAYLDADTPYNPCMRGEFADTDWNNKKYRNLIVVDPLLISAVRGYPCANENLDDVIIEKLKTLALENMGWTFEDEIKKGTCRYDAENTYIRLETDKMYNDACNWDAHYVSGHLSNLDITPTTARKEEVGQWSMRYDGPVKCLECHGSIGESTHPRCSECRGIYTCHHCGDEVNEEYTVWVGDHPYCEYCYNENFFECPCCNERVESEWSDNGEIVNVDINTILESVDYDERVEKYKDAMKRYYERKENNHWVYEPDMPTKFYSKNAASLCADCLKKAIEDGYIIWNEFYYERLKEVAYSKFFLTDKAFKDEEFMDMIDISYNSNCYAPIGYEEYLTKLAVLKPVERPEH